MSMRTSYLVLNLVTLMSISSVLSFVIGSSPDFTFGSTVNMTSFLSNFNHEVSPNRTLIYHLCSSYISVDIINDNGTVFNNAQTFILDLDPMPVIPLLIGEDPDIESQDCLNITDMVDSHVRGEVLHRRIDLDADIFNIEQMQLVGPENGDGTVEARDYAIGTTTLYKSKDYWDILLRRLATNSYQGRCHTSTPKGKSLLMKNHLCRTKIQNHIWPHHACRSGGSKWFTVSPNTWRYVVRDTFSFKIWKAQGSGYYNC